MGIGCRRDPLEANVWYVSAAGHGDERAKQRLAIIQAAASGQSQAPATNEKGKLKKGKDGKDENCAVM
jgi:TPR repeat protein